jgi:hypothetical protein
MIRSLLLSITAFVIVGLLSEARAIDSRTICGIFWETSSGWLDSALWNHQYGPRAGSQSHPGAGQAYANQRAVHNLVVAGGLGWITLVVRENPPTGQDQFAVGVGPSAKTDIVSSLDLQDGALQSNPIWWVLTDSGRTESQDASCGVAYGNEQCVDWVTMVRGGWGEEGGPPIPRADELGGPWQSHWKVRVAFCHDRILVQSSGAVSLMGLRD